MASNLIQYVKFWQYIALDRSYVVTFFKVCPLASKVIKKVLKWKLFYVPWKKEDLSPYSKVCFYPEACLRLQND